jgi:hypothetical protein
VLPTLWEAVSGTREVTWGVEKPEGGFTFTREMARCWAWKDELPAQRLGAVGKHFGGWAALIAPRLVSHAYAAAAERRDALTDFHREIAEAVREAGPCTGPELRKLVGAEKKHVDQLQRAFVLTNSNLVAQRQGWDAIAVDLVERMWRIEPVADAESELARTVLRGAGEISAADLGGALGRRVKASREMLDMLVERGEATRREVDGIALWSP